jgi:hypothetical protein
MRHPLRCLRYSLRCLGLEKLTSCWYQIHMHLIYNIARILQCLTAFMVFEFPGIHGPWHGQTPGCPFTAVANRGKRRPTSATGVATSLVAQHSGVNSARPMECLHGTGTVRSSQRFRLGLNALGLNSLMRYEYVGSSFKCMDEPLESHEWLTCVKCD